MNLNPIIYMYFYFIHNFCVEQNILQMKIACAVQVKKKVANTLKTTAPKYVFIHFYKIFHPGVQHGKKKII